MYSGITECLKRNLQLLFMTYRWVKLAIALRWQSKTQLIITDLLENKK